MVISRRIDPGYKIEVMKRSLILFSLTALPLLAADFADRLADSAALFEEIMTVKERSIPQDLFEKSQCVIIVPGMKKAAFGIGAKFGRGFAVCRKESGTGWGNPGAVRVEGGSFGFQIGVSSTDVVMLVMNKRGMTKLLQSKFTLGADANVAAGPVGRETSAQTDAYMSAEILSWSRSKGLFAGIALNGATLRNDLDTNKEMYGQRWTNKEVMGSGATPPPSADKLLSTLSKYSMKK